MWATQGAEFGPGTSLGPFNLSSDLGYSSPAARTQMLQHSMFKDAKVELFVKHGSKQWTRLGEFRVTGSCSPNDGRSMTGRTPADPSKGASPRSGRAARTAARPVDAAAVVVSNVIGSGILLMPAIVARMTPDYWALMSVWLVGGPLAFAGAMAYAELATMRPRAGGEYVYLRAAYGPLRRVPTGWTSFVAGFSGAIAAAAVGLAGFLGVSVPVLGDRTPLGLAPARRAVADDLAAEPGGDSDHRRLQLVHAIGPRPGPRRPEHARRRSRCSGSPRSPSPGSRGAMASPAPRHRPRSPATA